jgi:imidazolonepropionase-like amidohydrolase
MTKRNITFAACRTTLGIALLVLGLVVDRAHADDVLFENVTLIDGTGAAPLANASVLIKGERIELVSPVPLRHRAGVRVVNGKGKFLIPGLIDSHIHLQGGRLEKDGHPSSDRALGIQALQGYLYSGVTSVYDSGNNPDFIFGLREEERAGRIVSPRIYAAGSVVAFPGGYASGPDSVNIGDWASGEAALARYLERKPDLLKIVVDGSPAIGQDTPRPTFAADTLKQIIHFANTHGLRTTAHVSLESDAWESIDGGIDDMAHPLRSPASDAYFTLVATKRIPICTTTAVFMYIANIADDPSFLDAPLYRATIDPQLLERAKTTERQRYISSGMSAKFKRTNASMLRNIKRLFDSGALLSLGTDRTWGPTVHLELATLHEAGIPLFDLVRIATLNAAIYLGQDQRLGSIERGKLADLLLLKADPTADVQNFQAIDAVYKGGSRIDLAALDLPINASGGYRRTSR